MSYIAQVFALEEVMISTCRSSRVITYSFYGKTQWQIFLLLYGRHVGPMSGGPIKAYKAPYKVGQNIFPNNRAPNSN